MNPRSLFSEALGTALLVFFGVGTATLTFGFKVTGTSMSAGIVATALAFGLVLLVLVYALGPISGCHINPAVTIGFLLAPAHHDHRSPRLLDRSAHRWHRRCGGAVRDVSSELDLHDDDGAGGRRVRRAFPGRPECGRGVPGRGHLDVHLCAVLVVLAATRRVENATVAGIAIGLALTLVHIIGIPLTGTSVNPARSIGPALFVGGDALTQLWVFIIAPLVGGALSSLVYLLLYPEGEIEAAVEPAPELQA